MLMNAAGPLSNHVCDYSKNVFLMDFKAERKAINIFRMYADLNE